MYGKLHVKRRAWDKDRTEMIMRKNLTRVSPLASKLIYSSTLRSAEISNKDAV